MEQQRLASLADKRSVTDVTQTVCLLYRRLAACKVWGGERVADCQSATQQTASLRYKLRSPLANRRQNIRQYLRLRLRADVAFTMQSGKLKSTFGRSRPCFFDRL